MNYVQPIYIPASSSSEPSKCPSCDKKEDIKKVCRHCDYEYKEPPTTFTEGLVAFMVIVSVIWLCVTILVWLMDYSFGDKKTLLDMFIAQWEFIKNLRLW